MGWIARFDAPSPIGTGGYGDRQSDGDVLFTKLEGIQPWQEK
jgi:hypothetical protein